MEEKHLDTTTLTTLKNDVNSLHNLIKKTLDPPNLSSRLYDAAIKGDLNTLHILIQQDPLILDRCIIKKSDSFMQSPLHVSASLGHLDFTSEILRLKPELATQLDQSNRASALHLASKNGHLDIVKKLLEVNPSMCLGRDQDGRNPVHIAAISNQLHVLDFLVCMNPNAARQRTNDGETLLHLCINYAQLDSLKYLVNAMGELLNAKDNDGNTVLHLAVLANQPEAAKLLVTNKKMQRNAINKDGLTAIDCLFQGEMDLKDTEIHRTFKRAKVLKAKHVEKRRADKNEKWLKKQRNTLMVVASLIAGMAFQVGVNLHDGVVGLHTWDSVGVHSITLVDLTVIVANTISLTSSLSVVLLLISGLPCKRLLVIILMISMWVAISATLFTYSISVGNFLLASVGVDYENYGFVLFPVLLTWVVWVAILLFGHIIRFLIKPAKKLVQAMKKMWRWWTRKKGLNTDPLPQFLN